MQLGHAKRASAGTSCAALGFLGFLCFLLCSIFSAALHHSSSQKISTLRFAPHQGSFHSQQQKQNLGLAYARKPNSNSIRYAHRTLTDARKLANPTPWIAPLFHLASLATTPCRSLSLAAFASSRVGTFRSRFAVLYLQHPPTISKFFSPFQLSGAAEQRNTSAAEEMDEMGAGAVGGDAYQLSGWIPGGAGWSRCGMMRCGRRLASEVMRWRIL